MNPLSLRQPGIAWRGEYLTGLIVSTGMALLIVLLAGCATVPEKTIVLPESFWQKKDVKIGVAMVASPKGAEHMVGPQDELDRAIARKIDARLASYLESVQPREFGQIAQTFAERLRGMGYTASVIAEPLSSQHAALETKGSTTAVDGILTPIRTKYGIDRLLLLSIDRFGAVRDYFVFVATAAPQATFQVRGELIDLTSNTMLWRVSMAENQNVIPIEGEWNQPPDYPNLTQAIRRAEHDALVFLENAFFSGAP